VVGFRRFSFLALIAGALVCAVAAQTSSAPDTAPKSSSSTSDNSSSTKKTEKKSSKTSTAGKKSTRSARSRRASPRFKRMHQAFIASATLKPMAQQLLQNRSAAAYTGVETFARKHSAEDAGALAWLAVGYAHFLDHEYAKAIEPLNRARPYAGEIGDYVAFYLASSYLQSGRMAEGMAALGTFDKNYPQSVLTRDAHVLYANALLDDHRPKEAVAVLENDREPIRADLELVLGRAYEAAGDSVKAVAVLRHLYFTLPLSFETGAADAELQKLAATPDVAPPSFGERKSRADMLARAKRYQEAADGYRGLANEASATDKPDIELALADALRHAGQDREARKILDSLPTSTPEVAAQRLFYIGEMQRGAGHDDDYLKTVDQIRSAAPTSPWLDQALLNAANIYLLRKDYDKTIGSFRELEQRFPGGARAPYAHWKVAWLSLRQGRNDVAKKGFEQQIELYPDSAEVPAALYWRARLAEEDGDPAMASAFYQKISERFRNYYYGPLARERISKLSLPSSDSGGAAGDPPGDPRHYAILDHVPPITSLPTISNAQVPDDNLRVEKARLLENGGLLDFSLRELKAAAEEEKGDWLPAETARMYEDAGRYDLAVETLKKAIPSYFALDLPALPRNCWEGLFPRPYWNDLKKFATANGLDPYIVASLIRQESEFNPNAVSNRNALGLMQLLPSVGKSVAKQEKLKHFSAPQLFTPVINLRLGTKYFRSMVDEFGGFEYALAAYNAGDDRVKDWQSQGKYRDVPEFVESIPFTQTREYVQAIMRNANVYRQLYGAP
jgi:soluble lytic murein transglycosylase